MATHKDQKVMEARDKALEKALEVIEKGGSYHLKMVAVQAILNYDIQLHILQSGSTSNKQPTPWPSLRTS